MKEDVIFSFKKISNSKNEDTNQTNEDIKKSITNFLKLDNDNDIDKDNDKEKDKNIINITNKKQKTNKNIQNNYKKLSLKNNIRSKPILENDYNQSDVNSNYSYLDSFLNRFTKNKDSSYNEISSIEISPNRLYKYKYSPKFSILNNNIENKNIPKIINTKKTSFESNNKTHITIATLSNIKTTIEYTKEQYFSEKKYLKFKKLKETINKKNLENYSDRPKINSNSKKIIVEKFKNQKPIYKRYIELKIEKENKIDYYKKKYNRINSARNLNSNHFIKYNFDNNKYNNNNLNPNDNPNDNNISNDKKFDDWIIKNRKWSEKRNRKIIRLKNDIDEQKIESSVITTFTPKINQISDMIANTKNFNDYPGIETHEKLYNFRDNRQKNLNILTKKEQPSFSPVINIYKPRFQISNSVKTRIIHSDYIKEKSMERKIKYENKIKKIKEANQYAYNYNISKDLKINEINKCKKLKAYEKKNLEIEINNQKNEKINKNKFPLTNKNILKKIINLKKAKELTLENFRSEEKYDIKKSDFTIYDKKKFIFYN
jgi:hypothetical protein